MRTLLRDPAGRCKAACRSRAPRAVRPFRRCSFSVRTAPQRYRRGPRSRPLPRAGLSLSRFRVGKVEIIDKGGVDAFELIRCHPAKATAQARLVHRGDLFDQSAAVAVGRGDVNVATELAALGGRARHDGNCAAGACEIITAYDNGRTAIHDLIAGSRAGRDGEEIDFSAFHKVSPFRIASASELAPVWVMAVK